MPSATKHGESRFLFTTMARPPERKRKRGIELFDNNFQKQQKAQSRRRLSSRLSAKRLIRWPVLCFCTFRPDQTRPGHTQSFHHVSNRITFLVGAQYSACRAALCSVAVKFIAVNRKEIRSKGCPPFHHLHRFVRHVNQTPPRCKKKQNGLHRFVHLRGSSEYCSSLLALCLCHISYATTAGHLRC